MRHFLVLTILTHFCAGSFAQTSTSQNTGVQPEFGFVLDGVATSSKDSGLGAEMLMAEMSLSSRIDPAARAYAIIEFPSMTSLDVAEAVVVFDKLGNEFELKVGKMNLDLGKYGTVHRHDLAMPFGDPVRAALFGGPLQGTGLELHKWMAAGDVPIRFSIGAWGQAGSHSHAEEGHGEDHGEEEEHHHAGISSSDERLNFANWSLSGRLSSQLDFGTNGWWQWGVSYFENSGGLGSEWENELEPNDPLFASGEASGLSAKTIGFDLSVYSADLTGSRFHRASLEYWNHLQDVAHAEGAAQTFELETLEPQGAWFVTEHGLAEGWSIASQIGWWESEVEEQLESSYRYGLALNRNISEFNRLRLAVEEIDDASESEKAMEVTLQWSAFMGKHRHGIDW
ncbi:MAG: hypothetical protein QGF46_00520 [Planctomycetota bacterium]|jgi:hypothetical protein|nr:hypothetical protein [Planctomycetota bacterium]